MIIVFVTTKETSLGTDFNQEKCMYVSNSAIENWLKPSISSYSNPLYEVSYKASQMFCFKAECIQNQNALYKTSYEALNN